MIEGQVCLQLTPVKRMLMKAFWNLLYQAYREAFQEQQNVRDSFLIFHKEKRQGLAVHSVGEIDSHTRTCQALPLAVQPKATYFPLFGSYLTQLLNGNDKTNLTDL